MKTSQLIITLLATLLSVTAASAKISKGKKVYMQKCKSCHGNGTKGAAMQTMDEWNELFAEDAIEIKERHDATKAKSYFNSDLFKRHAPHLRDFLHEYGSDSGNIPAC